MTLQINTPTPSSQSHVQHPNHAFTASPHFINLPTTSQSTLQSANPRQQASGNFFDSFHNAWEAIVNFFKSLLNCFELFSNVTQNPNTLVQSQSAISPAVGAPSIQIERETRLSFTDAQIQQRLEKQMQRVQEQMQNQRADAHPFREHQHPTTWNSYQGWVDNMSFGISRVQGRRETMEDECLAVSFNAALAGGDHPIQLFGIFDGHGGPEASGFVRLRLQYHLHQQLIRWTSGSLSNANIWRALKATCLELNREFKNRYPGISDRQGTTATFAMILNNKLWTANVGDSRTVLNNNGTPVQLSEDAKPGNDYYRGIIENRGGQVVAINGVPKINGDLAVARAIGDHRLNSAISARPKITVKPLHEVQPGSHLILCSGRVYDVCTTRDITQLTHGATSTGAVAAKITYSAFMQGSQDNLSALVVKIR